MTKQEMRLIIQRGGWRPYRSKTGGEMYTNGESVVCFHSNLYLNTKTKYDVWKCADCEDASMTKEEFPYSFTSYDFTSYDAFLSSL